MQLLNLIKAKLNTILLEQIDNFIRIYSFTGKDKIPFYTDIKTLLKDHPRIKSAIKENNMNINDLTDGFIRIDDDWAILLGKPKSGLKINANKMLGIPEYDQAYHEAEHLLLIRRKFLNPTTGEFEPYTKEQQDLLNLAYKHSLNGIEEASNIEEKGAVNNLIRTALIELFKIKYRRYPSLDEYEKFIDSYPNNKLLLHLKQNTNLYGEEYASNLPDAIKMKEALKWIGIIKPLFMKKGED